MPLHDDGHKWMRKGSQNCKKLISGDEGIAGFPDCHSRPPAGERTSGRLRPIVHDIQTSDLGTLKNLGHYDTTKYKVRDIKRDRRNAMLSRSASMAFTTGRSWKPSALDWLSSM